jgi:hypothetical protein
MLPSSCALKGVAHPQAPDGIPKHRCVSQETLEPIHPRMYFVPSAVSGTDGYLTFHKTAYDQYAALSAAPYTAGGFEPLTETPLIAVAHGSQWPRPCRHICTSLSERSSLGLPPTPRPNSSF